MKHFIHFTHIFLIGCLLHAPVMHLVRESCLHLVMCLKSHGAFVHKVSFLINVGHCHVKVCFISRKVYLLLTLLDLSGQIADGTPGLHLEVKILLGLRHHCPSEVRRMRQMVFRTVRSFNQSAHLSPSSHLFQRIMLVSQRLYVNSSRVFNVIGRISTLHTQVVTKSFINARFDSISLFISFFKNKR